MKKVGIILIIIAFILMNLNCIYASSNNTRNQNITINYPSHVNFGEVFMINLGLDNFQSDSYDVRLGLITNSTRISRIWNENSWQSTYYYVNDAINTTQKNNETFRLNVTSCYNGVAGLEITIRDSKGNLYNFYNYTINVNCQLANNDSDNNENIDNSDETDNTEDDSEENIISLMLDWDSGDIVNGHEFEIKLDVSDFEEKDYDLKVFIYDDNENSPISQTYWNGKWISSNNYINKIFRGPGDKTENIKLRIKDSYKDFGGEATIGVRIRESGASSYKEEIQETIDIIKEEQDVLEENVDDSNINNDALDENITNENSEEISNEVSDEEIVYHLDTKSESIKSKKILYKSKNELIKEYSIYSFILLGVIFLITIVLYKFKKIWQKK